jgi:hypothetical protein
MGKFGGADDESLQSRDENAVATALLRFPAVRCRWIIGMLKPHTDFRAGDGGGSQIVHVPVYRS